MSVQAEIRRTYSEVIKSADFNEVAAALGLQVKNLENATLWIIRNILTAIDRDGSLKANLNEQQLKALNEVNQQVRQLNKEHRRKNRLLKKDPKKKLLRIYKEFGVQANRWEILSMPLLDRVIRAHRDQDGFLVYGALPGVVAQQAIIEVVESFQSYKAALDLYQIEPERFTGRPQWPDYHDRNERATATFTAGSLEKKDGYRFISVADKTLHIDYAKSAELTDPAKVSFANYALNETLADMRQRVKLPDAARLCEVRLVPQPGRQTKLEAVYTWPATLPEGSFAARMYAELEAKYPKLKRSQVNDALLQLLADLPEQEMPRTAGLDPGLNNFVTLGYSTGDRGLVLSNKGIEGPLAEFDRAYDHLKSKHTSRDLSDLLVRNMRRALSKAEVIRMKKELKALHANEEILALLRDRDNWEQDALHKVSTGVVDFMVKRRIGLLIIGLNQLWKNGCWMGKKMDRRFLRSAHTRLIELLKYKCLEAGILVVITEEAYTSQRSFVLNEPIPKWQPKEDNHEVIESNTAEAETDDRQAKYPLVQGQPTMRDKPSATPDDNGKLRGYRGRDDLRHFYFSPGAPEGWQVIHADLNGAYNIIRKVFRSFRQHAGLSPNVLIFRFDRKANLTRLQLKRAA